MNKLNEMEPDVCEEADEIMLARLTRISQAVGGRIDGNVSLVTSFHFVRVVL